MDASSPHKLLPLLECICYPSKPMFRLKVALICLFAFLSMGDLRAGTYTLLDGTTISGEPVSYDRNGVVLKSGNTFQPRTPWEKISQESLKQLATEAKRPQDAAQINPHLEETQLEKRKAREDIPVKQPAKVEMPTGRLGLFAAFGSPLGLTLIFLLYGANIYMGYEAARFRMYPVGVVCAASAALPLIGPAAFVLLPRKAVAGILGGQSSPAVESELVVTEAAPAEAVEPEPPAAAAAPLSPAPHAAAGPARTFKLSTQDMAAQQAAAAPAPIPAPVVFQRGQFTFNRRFFETKMPGFFRVVPSEADKDMVLYIKCVRGEFVGKRISKINQTELHLLTFKEEATAEEMIPFAEIQEVQIRHKDIV